MTKEVYNLIKETKQKVNEVRSVIIDNIGSIIEKVTGMVDDEVQVLLPEPILLVFRKNRGHTIGSLDFNRAVFIRHFKGCNSWLEDEDGKNIVLLIDLSLTDLVELLGAIEKWAKEE